MMISVLGGHRKVTDDELDAIASNDIRRKREYVAKGMSLMKRSAARKSVVQRRNAAYRKTKSRM